MTHTELTHPTDISNTSCGTVVGFIPVPRSRRRLVCQQIALRFATALKREAFSSILRDTGGDWGVDGYRLLGDRDPTTRRV